MNPEPQQVSRRKGRGWTLEETLALGTVSDAEASKRLNRSISSVTAKREALNRPPFRPNLTEEEIISLKKSRTARDFPWTTEEDSLLGKFTDREVAEKLNRTLYCARGRRKFLGIPGVGWGPQPKWAQSEPEDHYAYLFATKSDREIRAMLGWSYKRIRTRRRQLGQGWLSKYPQWSLEE